MPKQGIKIENFKGLMSNADDQGVDIEYPIYSLNIDPIAPYGRLQGIPTHRTNDGATPTPNNYDATNTHAIDAVNFGAGLVVNNIGGVIYELNALKTVNTSKGGSGIKRGTLVASASEVYMSNGSVGYVYTELPNVTKFFGNTTSLPTRNQWAVVLSEVTTKDTFSIPGGITATGATTALIAGTYFVGVSLIYNNGSESDLQAGLASVSSASTFSSLDFDIQVDYDADWAGANGDSRPVTVNVYVAYNPDTSANTPATAYRLAATSGVTSNDWTYSSPNSTASFVLTDVFSGITYEASSDQSESAIANSVGYDCAADLFSRMAVADGSTIYLSRPLQYGVFDTARDFIEMPSNVKKMIGHQGKLYAFMQGGTGIINVNGPEPFLEEILEGVGIHDECMPLSTDYGLFHMSEDQLYRDLKPIGFPVINGVDGDYGTIDYKTDTKQYPFVAFDYHRGCALFFTGIQTDLDDNNNVYVYSLVKEEWYYWEVPGSAYFFYDDQDTIFLFGADSTDAIKELFGGSTLKPIKWESREIDLGRPHEKKWFYEWRQGESKVKAADSTAGSWTNSVVKVNSGTTYNEGSGNGPAAGSRAVQWFKFKLDNTASEGAMSYVTASVRQTDSSPRYAA